ncbi:lytic polysaccharide monooxygenase auxiliary activity family 9 protein [Sphaerisporangium perillae]|uniref:lytic polysaccharide monooxygenase auxiliary activity family 9 protein n=1 Tax=Sphaerisporangium perillae TaxID=2935860 RepID=UPI00200F486D|nr:lytic polysaccharide monooxygenase [Sphaerisporangium perillae]
MIAWRRITLTAAAFGATHLLLGSWAAGPAGAHGALENPLSRAAACAPERGEAATSKACAAAMAKSAPNALDDWDTLRVPGVGGRDREVIPDGELCSAGLPRFAGLDLPRGDWPATELPAGATFTFKYRATIPHMGTFRMYVTKDGYTPTQPLKWSALESEPFLRATDPALVRGAYKMKGKLPSGKTGRHLIYTVWQNSDTPDTYYSCSDVVFRPAGTDAQNPPATADEESSPAGTDEANGTDGTRTDGLNDSGGLNDSDGSDGADGEQAAGEADGAGGSGGPALESARPAAEARDATPDVGWSRTIPLVAGGVLLLLVCAGALVALTRRTGARHR